MNQAVQASALAALLAAGAAHAQFVKGNEAVKTLPDGAKKVETPPFPPKSTASKAPPCAPSAGCHAGTWLMVETDQGLLECTEVYARPTGCRASTYRAVKLRRLWVVKVNSTWIQCQFPDLKSKCVPVFAKPPANLPYDAMQ